MEKPPRIAIIDYKMSNMFSIKNALDLLGFESEVTSEYKSILSADGAILPGVGSFPEAIKHIKVMGLDSPVKEFISSGKPFMGICLGLQLLFRESEEFKYSDGLGIIEGRVESLTKHKGVERIPHVGWNSIKKISSIGKRASVAPLKKVKSGEHFYFVHSYYVNPDNESDICTVTEYGGIEFCSSISRDNIFACQFHPEKSGRIGIQILKDCFSI